MTVTDPNLVNAVTNYRVQRDRIKNRQKRELESELFEWKADVGDEINRVRKQQGASIQEIGNIMGVQNRTFIYEMISCSNLRNKSLPNGTPVTEDESERPPYTIEYGDGVARVTFDEDESYDISIIDGLPDIPEEWGEHTRTRRDLYKQIIKEIKSHD